MTEDACVWCKYNAHGCNTADCDFKTLAYEKKAILERLTIERVKVDGIREKFLANGKELSDEMMIEVADMVDVMKGMQIMVDRLVTDFEMKNDEIYEEVGFTQSKLSFVAKAKLMLKLRQLKKKRGAK